MVGFTYRFLNVYRKLKNLTLKKKAISTEEIASIKIDRKKERYKWLFSKRYSPGAIFSEVGSHLIDRVCWLNNIKVKKVYAWLLKESDNKDLGGFAYLISNDFTGKITILPFTKNFQGFYTTDILTRNRERIACTVKKSEKRSIIFHSNHLYNIELNDPFQEEIDSFVNSVIEDKTPPITSLDGLKNIKILLAIYKSDKKIKLLG